MTAERKQRIFKDLLEDWENAKNSKVTVDKEIAGWNDLYNGISKDNTGKKLLMKEVAKMIEAQKPNITEPFLSTTSPIKIPLAGNIATSSEIENYVNGVFMSDIDREEFINNIVDLLLREGTVWTRTGWVREEMTKEVSSIVTMQELLSMDIEPKSIKETDDPMLFKITNDELVTVKNHPNSRVCRNENIYPDPTARQEREMNFLIEKRYVTYYDLVAMNIYDAATLRQLKIKIETGSSGYREAGTLESQRDSDNANMGSDHDMSSDNLNRKKIALMEYWGYYDLEGKGKRTSIVASWIHEYEFLLEIEETPMPSKKIPYQRAVYSPRPFGLWGNALAFYLGENQNVKNGIVRGILDNTALANNGQKFIRRGALDFVNFKRLQNKERYVIVNKPDGIEDGKHNQIPGSIFNLLEMVNMESSQMVGVDGNTISKSDIAKDNDTRLSTAQQKMVSVVRTVSSLLGKNTKEWLSMSEVFLDDEQIIALFSNDDNPENDLYDINAFRDSHKTRVAVTVGTDVSRQQELQQLNMLMQQAKVLGEQLPQGHIHALVAKMYDLFDMKEKANELRNYRPEPTEQEKIVQQMQMQEAQLNLMRIQKEIQKIDSEIIANGAKAQAVMSDSQSNAMYKNAQANEKMAKTESHQVDSALKPGEAMMAIREKQQNLIKGGNDG
jgi:hypothetical protein